MATTKKCPKCGTDLPANVPDSQCPKCLLQVGLGSQPDATDGTQPLPQPESPPTPAQLAPHFPQLEILGLLGQGGMGVVYRARQPRLDRMVALKILSREAARDPAFAERFTREARALARLSHPNIVAVYDFGEAEGMFYFLMEYVDGANLRQLEQGGNLTPAEALKIVPAICSALQYAHDQGIVHRDIKPENILVDKQGQVRIADFGLAKLLDRPATAPTLTQTRQVMGTPHYMAPEQIESPQQVDHRADIYSLGVVFYEMLTGELPIGRFAPPSSRGHGVQIDVRLDQVVLRALEKERELRYQHVSEVKTDVESITSSPAQPPPPPAAHPAAGIAPGAFQAVKGPAIGLVVTGILNWVLIPFYLLIAVFFTRDGTPSPAVAIVVIGAALCGGGGFIIFAGLKMKALEAYRAALAGSILAILISPGNLIGLPIGIWALVTLTRSRVKEAFRSKPNLLDTPSWSAPAASVSPADKARRWFYTTAAVFLTGVGLLVLLIIGLLTLSLVLPALSRAKSKAQNFAAARQTVQARLESAIAEHLHQADFQYDSMELKFSPDMNSAQCFFSGLREQTNLNGTSVSIPRTGKLDLVRNAAGIWQVHGEQELSNVEFNIEAPPASVLPMDEPFPAASPTHEPP